MPILMKLYTGIGETFTSIDEIEETSWPFPNTILLIPVYDFTNTGLRFCQYWYMILPIPVYDVANTSI